MLKNIRMPRMTLWLAVSAVLLIVGALLSPAMTLGVTVYKLSLITTAAWLAYWIDRAVFPYGRPDFFTEEIPECEESEDEIVAMQSDPEHPQELTLRRFVRLPSPEFHWVFCACMLRRAVIMAAAMLAAALGA